MIEDFEERKRKGIRLVSRKSSRKRHGKWKKLEDLSNNDRMHIVQENEQTCQVFGVPVQTAVDMDPSMDGIPLPAFLRNSINYIETYGITQEGIYRVSCPKSRLDELERTVNEGGSLCFDDVHEATGLIKRFLRQLSQPLLSGEFEMLVRNCSCGWGNVCQCAVFAEMKEKLRGLSRPQFYLLGFIVLHIQNVINMEAQNKMGIHALGLLFQTIMNMSRQLICYLIMNGSGTLSEQQKDEFLFDNLKVMPYVPPRAATDIECWLCDDKPMIEEELNKQNCLLEHLHRKITRIVKLGRDASNFESQLWGVQTAITALKRRLKAVAEPTPSVTSMISNDQPCKEMFEEKQLMAVQSMLRQDILNQKRCIARSCWMLRLFGRNSFKSESLKESQTSEQESEEVWRERCKLEEAARAALVMEIVRLRNDCANLRAMIEFCGQRQRPITTKF